MTPIFDNHNRPLNYLRLAVTDRCNLRCHYCMPSTGIQYLPRKELLTFEEIERLVRLLAGMGISKVRLTGGEPFVRNDLMKLIRRIGAIPGIRDVHITTNGVLTAPHVPELKKLGIASVNLSLDTLDAGRFKEITLRDEFQSTWRTLKLLLEHGIPVKINTVVMDGKNTEDILPLVELTRALPLSVRFIEEMPFNGSNRAVKLRWTYAKILEHISSTYPAMEKLKDEQGSTSFNYRIHGHAGTFGIIAAFSRTFCGSCNRLRVTAQGVLKTCLYDGGVLDIKSLLRSGISDERLAGQLRSAFQRRPANGFEAEERRAAQSIHESMSTIGG